MCPAPAVRLRPVRERLAFARADFDDLTTNTAEVLYVYDAGLGALAYLSPSFEKVWGEPRDRMLADLGRWAEMLHPDDRDLEVEFQRALHGSGVAPVVGRYRIVRPDGALREIRDTAVPLRDGSGRLTHVVGIATDVTEELSSSRKVSVAGAAWSAILHEAPFGIGLFSPDGVCLRIGRTLESLNGLSEADHLGKVVWDLAPSLRETVKPIFDRIKADGRPVLNVEIAGRPARLDGVLRRSRCSYIPVMRDGTPEVIVAIIHDVTDERLEQEAAAADREREARARLALKAGRLVPWEVDAASGRIVADEQLMDMFGLDGDLPASVDAFVARIHPDDRESTLREFGKAALPGGSYHARFRVVHPLRGTRWLVGTAEGIVGADGGVRIVGYNGDVTQEVADEQERALIADELMHRTKNLLATVRSIATLSGQGAKDVQEFLSTFDGRIMAIARSFGQLRGGNWRVVAIDALARDCLSHLGDAHVRITGPEAWISAEASQRLGLVLHELATNALKYGALSVPEGEVELSWSLGPDGGIALEWMERGGPPVAAKGQGFGTKLIARLTGPKGSYCLSPQGVRWTDVLEVQCRPANGD